MSAANVGEPGSPVPLHSRQGRAMQRYGDDGARLVAGCIPMQLQEGRGEDEGVDAVQVLMVSSRNGKGMVFPKGGWEQDESVEIAAVRECLEEGGVRGRVVQGLGKFSFKSKKGKGRECVAEMFVLEVDEVLDKWPESHERTRAWLSVSEAYSQCRHDWMRDALDHWSQLKGWRAPGPGAAGEGA